VSSSAGKRPSRAPKTLNASENPNLGADLLRRVKAQYRPVLVVLSGNEVGRRVAVDRTLVVGRDPSASLTLTDALVSWHHARIEDRGDSWAVVDLESTNGTIVNGEKRNESELKQNDRIVFGTTVVSFEIQDGVVQAYNETVERLLNIDDLSGLFVRRKFDRELTVRIDAARVVGERVSLLVMDLDGVKRINDTHGHLFGAYVIGESGRLIGQVLGERGFACRFGGDEYLAALPGIDVVGACAIAEEIRQAIAAHPFEREGVQLRPGISIGVAEFPSDAPDVPSLFQRADEALYRAKQAGKNRVAR
jgi:diguanylate cyclase (GGDEF)-like protein